MPRKSIDIRAADHPLLPARTGLGRAQDMGQGTRPLRVLRAVP